MVSLLSSLWVIENVLFVLAVLVSHLLSLSVPLEDCFSCLWPFLNSFNNLTVKKMKKPVYGELLRSL